MKSKMSFRSLINRPGRNLRRTCTEAAGVPVLLVLCVCWGRGEGGVISE